MFSSGANYNKLKTNLRLSINRLKLLEKKKAEMAMKSRKVSSNIIQSPPHHPFSNKGYILLKNCSYQKAMVFLLTDLEAQVWQIIQTDTVIYTDYS